MSVFRVPGESFAPLRQARTDTGRTNSNARLRRTVQSTPKKLHDFMGDRSDTQIMDHLDKVRKQVVEALMKLDEAIEGAMLAQAPSSSVDQLAIGLTAFRRGLNETLKIVERAEASLQHAKQHSS